jgi:hypothetical protein
MRWCSESGERSRTDRCRSVHNSKSGAQLFVITAIRISAFLPANRRILRGGAADERRGAHVSDAEHRCEDIATGPLLCAVSYYLSQAPFH